MKTILARTILLLFLLAGAALAQNSDLAILGGFIPTSGTVSNVIITGSVAFGIQIDYAAQLHETPAGQLYLELPWMIAGSLQGAVANDVTAHTTGTNFFTPGVRWRFTPQRRVSFYAAVGAGIGVYGNTISEVGQGAESTTSRTTTFAFGFGGGIDFRLTRLLSLRGEGRDFLTRSGLGGSSGPNHSFFMVGIGFHF
jgi:opacity protein-like surface antigen